MPKVSFLMSVYNSADTIEYSIKSLLNQNHKDFDLIIINDQSTDNTLDIISNINDHRIKLHNNPEKGLVNALNYGLNLCDCKYIARMDADDYSFPNRIITQERALEHNQNLVGCGSNIIYFGKLNSISNFELTAKKIKKNLIFNNPIANPTTFIRKSVIDENNIRYKNEYLYAEDYKFWCDLLNIGDFINLKETLLKYRVHEKQISTKYRKQQIKTHTRIVQENLSYHGINLTTDEIDYILFSNNSCNSLKILNTLFKLAINRMLTLETSRILIKSLRSNSTY